PLKRIPIKNVTMFIDPSRRVSCRRGGQLRLDIRLANTTNSSSGLKRHAGELSECGRIVKRNVRSAAPPRPITEMRRIAGLIVSLSMLLPTVVKPELPVKRVLTLDAARKIAGAAEAEAKKRGATVAIVVVDDGGHLLLLERLDDTQVASVEVGI